MYDAGAGDYFDVLAMQGYGLWSGPTDRRMRARVLNFSRPLYLREIMVENGDGQKPIWITEMNWNAPPEDFPDKQFGYVTAEQQARYAVDAFRRAGEEWPWVGVINVWFFKRASDAEVDQAMYYFRLVEPDFTPLPVYDALADYFHSPEAHVLHAGVHQEDHWLLDYEGAWQTRAEPGAELSAARYAAEGSGATVQFTFEGTDLWLKAGPGGRSAIVYSLDGGDEEKQGLEPGRPARLARGLDAGPHTITIRAESGPVSLDSLTVEARPALVPWLVAGASVVAAALLLAVVLTATGRRRRWYERGRARQ
jgi:hypothetical protein